MKELRVLFTKQGALKFISHLDVSRLMQRALARSELPIWYTEGFNPHLYITFAAPLSLGFQSEWELMDFRLIEDLENGEVLQRLSKQLPGGMQVLRVDTPTHKISQLAYCDYEVTLPLNHPEQGARTLLEMLAGPALCVQKKSKRGMVERDILPMLTLLSHTVEGDTLHFTLRCECTTQNALNPSLVVSALAERLGDTQCQPDYLRKVLLTPECTPFF